MTPEEIAEEIALRKRQLAAREGKPGYAENVRLLKYVIAQLEAYNGA
jgi:hypothetical protein